MGSVFMMVLDEFTYSFSRLEGQWGYSQVTSLTHLGLRWGCLDLPFSVWCLSGKIA